MQAIQPIIDAVRQAAALCRRVQTDYLTELSKNGEPVTIADYGSQAILARAIHSVYPNDAIIAEESASGFKRNVKPDQQATIAALVGDMLGQAVSIDDILTWLDYGQDTVSESTWIIDPIDGTRGFINRRRYVIGVGLTESGRAMGAVLGCPMRGDGELLVAWDGAAYRMPLYADGTPAPFGVSQRSFGEPIVPVDAITAVRAGSDVEQRIKSTFQLQPPQLSHVDAQLDVYVMIATGDSDIFLCKPIARCSQKVWDHAAGVALVEAAGGLVTDFEGEPLDFSQGDKLGNDSIAISNGRIHPYILDTVKARPKYI